MTETPKPRDFLLGTANRLVMGDRNNEYGPPTQDFERTAEMLNAEGFAFIKANGEIEEIKSHHIALIMITLKLSRLTWNAEKFDSWVDIAGYAACGWECIHQDELGGVNT